MEKKNGKGKPGKTAGSYDNLHQLGRHDARVQKKHWNQQNWKSWAEEAEEEVSDDQSDRKEKARSVED